MNLACHVQYDSDSMTGKPWAHPTIKMHSNMVMKAEVRCIFDSLIVDVYERCNRAIVRPYEPVLRHSTCSCAYLFILCNRWDRNKWREKDAVCVSELAGEKGSDSAFYRIHFFITKTSGDFKCKAIILFHFFESKQKIVCLMVFCSCTA